jgi:hypothetical protein
MVCFALMGFIVRFFRYKFNYLDVVWLIAGCALSFLFLVNSLSSEKIFRVSDYNTFAYFCLCVFVVFLSEIWAAPAKKLDRVNSRTRRL